MCGLRSVREVGGGASAPARPPAPGRRAPGGVGGSGSGVPCMGGGETPGNARSPAARARDARWPTSGSISGDRNASPRRYSIWIRRMRSPAGGRCCFEPPRVTRLARCGPTRRYGTCWTKTTAWNLVRRRRSWWRRSRSAYSSPCCLWRLRTFAGTVVPTPRHDTRLRLSLRDVTTHAVDPDKVHLVVGFRQHLIASLVRFREWHVSDVPFTGAAAGAGCYELQMTAHQSGDAVHLMLMLKEVQDSLYIWSDGFELRLENWFDSQRRVVHRVAMALERARFGRAAAACSPNSLMCRLVFTIAGCVARPWCAPSVRNTGNARRDSSPRSSSWHRTSCRLLRTDQSGEH